MPTRTRISVRPVVAVLLAVGALGIAACESGPPPKAREVRTITRDVPPILRNTIGAEASLTGDEPSPMTGYGLVVGLNGTGSNDVPLPVRTEMIDQMTRMGVGKERGSLSGVSPDQLIDDPNTAVVLVQAIIPPGAPAGWKFDARVDAVPGSSTRSLEGGTLWTTELRRGVAVPGGPATPALAKVYGPVFTNPFANPGGEGVDAVDQRTGIIMNGGAITNPQPLMLIMDNPSHSRARAVVSALSARYGRGTATGRSEDSIELKIPDAYRDKPEVFVRLVKHTRIDQAFPEEIAQRYVDTVKEQPELAEEISWCLAALGDTAIPFCRKLYDHPELLPRLAGVQAGARLGDPTVRPYLENLINAGATATRSQMIALMAELPQDPKVNAFLRSLLDSPDLDARVSAYEALDKRKDGVIRRRTIDNKFALHEVPSSEPTIYITQYKAPRIVVFGDALSLGNDSLVSAWDGRLMIDGSGSRARVFYKDARGGAPTTAEVDRDISKVITLLATKPTPESPAPGLDFSYSQTVSALNELVKHGALNAPIVPEQDKLALELLRANQSKLAQPRPELSESGTVESVAPVTPVAPARVETAEAGPDAANAEPPTRPLDEAREKQRKKYVVPLPPSAEQQKKNAKK
ncbi:MAG: flagellar basal body P-ring protein FlgI [Planctomycetes bacterium]|nr:flagellar basal body P-ring protein FlgI [Planctomycetota bacterium]